MESYSRPPPSLDRRSRPFAIGLVVLLFFVVIFLVGGLCCQLTPEGRDFFQNVKAKLRIQQPMIFPNAYLSVPKYCTPYAGCTAEKNYECDVAWRDCNAYQDCIEHRCEAKPGLFSNMQR